MPVEMEIELSKKALKIGRIAKMNKQEVMKSKPIELTSLGYKSPFRTANQSSFVSCIETSRINVPKYKLEMSDLDKQLTTE